MKLLNDDDLLAKGIRHSRTQRWRLTKARKFPAPVRIGSRLAWVESEIDEWIAARIAERDQREVA